MPVPNVNYVQNYTQAVPTAGQFYTSDNPSTAPYSQFHVPASTATDSTFALTTPAQSPRYSQTQPPTTNLSSWYNHYTGFTYAPTTPCLTYGHQPAPSPGPRPAYTQIQPSSASLSSGNSYYTGSTYTAASPSPRSTNGDLPVPGMTPRCTQTMPPAATPNPSDTFLQLPEFHFTSTHGSPVEYDTNQKSSTKRKSRFLNLIPDSAPTTCTSVDYLLPESDCARQEEVCTTSEPICSRKRLRDESYSEQQPDLYSASANIYQADTCQPLQVQHSSFPSFKRPRTTDQTWNSVDTTSTQVAICATSTDLPSCQLDPPSPTTSSSSETSTLSSTKPRVLCDVCQKTYSSNRNLRQHMLIHKGIKKYKCGFCQKAFRDRSTRNRHEHLHTGFRPHICSYCDKSFVQSGNLLRHQRKWHSEEILAQFLVLSSVAE